jgi:hypothetical protein
MVCRSYIVLSVRPQGEVDVGEGIAALVKMKEVVEKEESNDSVDTAIRFYSSSVSDTGLP